MLIFKVRRRANEKTSDEYLINRHVKWTVTSWWYGKMLSKKTYRMRIEHNRRKNKNTDRMEIRSEEKIFHCSSQCTSKFNSFCLVFNFVWNSLEFGFCVISNLAWICWFILFNFCLHNFVSWCLCVCVCVINGQIVYQHLSFAPFHLRLFHLWNIPMRKVSGRRTV